MVWEPPESGPPWVPLKIYIAESDMAVLAYNFNS
jgi:hypothetical protein